MTIVSMKMGNMGLVQSLKTILTRAVESYVEVLAIQEEHIKQQMTQWLEEQKKLFLKQKIQGWNLEWREGNVI